MFHSGKVCICIATFSTEFRIDANSCYLVDNRKIKPGILRSTRAEHDPKNKTITTAKKKTLLSICNRQANRCGAGAY